MGKSFKNNILVNKPPAPPIIIKGCKANEKSPPKHLSTALENLANNVPISLLVNCPTDKEINLNTKRCVNKCKEGFEINDAFKCNRIAKK